MGHGGEFWQNVVHWRRECILALRTWWTVWKGNKIWHWKMNSPGAQYATGEEWRNNSRKNEEMAPKWKRCCVVDVTGDGSKVCCCKEHYCIETWNVRSMNEGELEVLRQEMARVNIDHLGISELKWTRMGEFNSDDHCVYYCGQEYFRRNGVALIISKRVWNTVLGSSLKNDRMISVCPHISCQLNQFNSGVNIFSLKKDLNTAFKVVVVVVWSLCPLDSFLSHSLQHTRLPCSSVSPRVRSDSCPLSQWCYLTISSSATAFSSCAQFFPASEPF